MFQCILYHYIDSSVYSLRLQWGGKSASAKCIIRRVFYFNSAYYIKVLYSANYSMSILVQILQISTYKFHFLYCNVDWTCWCIKTFSMSISHSSIQFMIKVYMSIITVYLKHIWSTVSPLCIFFKILIFPRLIYFLEKPLYFLYLFCKWLW